MASQLDGTSSVSILYICKDDAAVAALKQFFEGHMEFMKNKCEKEGSRKLCTLRFKKAQSWKVMERLRLYLVKLCVPPEELYFTYLKFMKL